MIFCELAFLGRWNSETQPSEEVGGRELPLVLPPLFHEDGWAEGGHSAHVAQMDQTGGFGYVGHPQKKSVNSWGKKGENHESMSVYPRVVIRFHDVHVIFCVCFLGKFEQNPWEWSG
jgi:hypothetical protein